MVNKKLLVLFLFGYLVVDSSFKNDFVAALLEHDLDCLIIDLFGFVRIKVI